MSLFEVVLILSTQVFFFAFGWVFFMEKLFKDYEIRKGSVQLAFSVTFTLSCTLFELIIFEILDILNRETRWLLWKLAITLNLGNTVMLLPWYQIYLSVSKKGGLRLTWM